MQFVIFSIQNTNRPKWSKVSHLQIQWYQDAHLHQLKVCIYMVQTSAVEGKALAYQQ